MGNCSALLFYATLERMKIGVYGLGRFGQFWANHLSRFGSLYGYNRSEKTNLSPTIKMVDLETLLECDVLVLCVSISALEEVLKNIGSRIKAGTVVMDTCSVKVYPAKIMQTYLDKTVQIIATHPMFGPDSGKNGIENLPLVFSPIRCSDENINLWRSIFKEMKLKVLEMDCDTHDQQAAYSQGVTHFVGRVLDELKLEKTELATVGYNNLMTIVEQTCNDSIQLFYDLQRYNPYAHSMRLRLKEALDVVYSLLEEQDEKITEI